MKKLFSIALIAILGMSMAGCHIVPSGKVGLRTEYNNTIDTTVLPAGSINQTFVGKVNDYPIKQLQDDVKNLQPVTADNATMADVDVSAIYNIHPSCVPDFVTNKSAAFHGTDKEGDTLLMSNYVQKLVRNAVLKEARKYEAMSMNDNRANLEKGVQTTMNQMLADDKLENCITIDQIQANSLTPPEALKLAANNLVKAKIDNVAKDVEVSTAKKESERIAALNANAGAINYMNAQANMEIAHAVATGKVNTIILPYDFKGIVNAGK